MLATVAPDWLKEQVPPDWYERYGDRMEDSRLPKEKTEREALSRRIGDDGFHLLACVEQAAQAGMDWLQPLPAVQTLEQIWAQQYRITNGHARRLTPQERPPVGEWLRSPYDRDVRYGAQTQPGVGRLQGPCDRRVRRRPPPSHHRRPHRPSD